jgi:hypothetical protein
LYWKVGLLLSSSSPTHQRLHLSTIPPHTIVFCCTPHAFQTYCLYISILLLQGPWILSYLE